MLCLLDTKIVLQKQRQINKFNSNIKNFLCIDNLRKQKLSPSLALFSCKITTALEIEYRNEAKGIWSLLHIINNYIMQQLLTVSVSRGNKILEAMIFYHQVILN